MLLGTIPWVTSGRTPEFTRTTIRHLLYVEAVLGKGYLEYRDAAGRVADFHCLRHSFIWNLARGDVHPKVAQQLARHSTITLTMVRYSHTVLSELSALPEQASPNRTPEKQRATGTYDSAPDSLPISLPL